MQPAHHVADEEDRPANVVRFLQFVIVDGAAQRSPQVAEFDQDVAERRRPVIGGADDAAHIGPVIDTVTAAHGLLRFLAGRVLASLVAQRIQLLLAILARQLMDGVTSGVAQPQPRLVDQTGKIRYGGAGHLLCRVARAAAAEDRHLAQDALLLG